MPSREASNTALAYALRCASSDGASAASKPESFCSPGEESVGKWIIYDARRARGSAVVVCDHYTRNRHAYEHRARLLAVARRRVQVEHVWVVVVDRERLRDPLVERHAPEQVGDARRNWQRRVLVRQRRRRLARRRGREAAEREGDTADHHVLPGRSPHP